MERFENMIDPNNNKIAILILFMEDQWNATKLTLSCIAKLLSPNDTVVLLLNGCESEKIRNEFELMFSSFHLFESNKNLGVAGGRNYLMQTQEVKDADYIFHLDNDILPSKNYFEEMITFIEKHPDAGIVGPLVFKAHYLLLYFFKNEINETNNIQSNLVLDSYKIISDWAKTSHPEPWHFGVSKNWSLSYCSIWSYTCNQLCIFLGITPIFKTYHIYNAKILENIKTGANEILSSNIAGCATLYRRELVKDIGLYDESFNPYSLEDVEFCVRAMNKGYTNYINPKVALFHGTDLRSKNRKSYFSIKQKIITAITLRRRLIRNKLKLYYSIFSYLGMLMIWTTLLAIRDISFKPLLEYSLGSFEGIRRKPLVNQIND